MTSYADPSRPDRAVPDSAVLDAAVLEDLVGDPGEDGTEFIAELVEVWRTETARHLEEVDQAPARTLHTLKGSSAAVGAIRLAGTCARHEELLAGGAPYTTASTATLRTEAEQALSALQGLIATRRGGGGTAPLV